MKCYYIVAWTYNADIHCPGCASDAGMLKDDAEDSEGNEPHPVFAADMEQPEFCGTCGEQIED